MLRGMLPLRISLNQKLFLLSLSFICGTLFILHYRYFPNLPHDSLPGYILLEELRRAFSFGVLDPEYSPFRCFGLPLFANTNSANWTLYHLLAWVSPYHSLTLLLVPLLFAIVGFVGCLEFIQDRFPKLTREWALGLSLGWTLQGFLYTHLLAGHGNFYFVALFPYLYLGLTRFKLRDRGSILRLAGISFLAAHMVLISGAYLALFLALNALLVWGCEWFLNPEKVRGTWKSTLVASGIGGFFTTAMLAPKLIATHDFLSRFPRPAHFAQLEFKDGLLFTLSQFPFAIAWDYRSMMGWIYGNWESYMVLFPLGWVVLIMAPLSQKGLAFKEEKKFWGILAVLILISATLTSGMLSQTLKNIPIIGMLHVNPRWHAVILLPLLYLFVYGWTRLRLAATETRIIQGILVVIWAGAPYFFLDQDNFSISFPSDHPAFVSASSRLPICYEPLFGYKLENFPRKDLITESWTTAPLRDPRCYLDSATCEAGRLLTDPTELKQLNEYSLQSSTPAFRRFKALSFFLYFASFLAFIFSAFNLIRREIKKP